MTIRWKMTPVLMVAFFTRGYAHESGTPFAQWMRSLMRPDAAFSCCGLADQYWVKEYHPSDKPNMAFTATVFAKDGVTEFTADVPKKAVIWDRVNPTGRGVLFIGQTEFGVEFPEGTRVVCFVPSHGV